MRRRDATDDVRKPRKVKTFPGEHIEGTKARQRLKDIRVKFCEE